MFPVKVIAIDNEKKELDLAVYGLSKALIPMVPILYDPVDGVKGSIPEPLKGIRVVFCDINLLDASSPSLEAKQVIGPISDVLKSVIAKENGPYALIFWSKHTRLANEIKEEMHLRLPDTPTPTIIASIDKTLIPGFDTTHTNGDKHVDKKSISAFNEKLAEIINENPVSKLFSLWEGSCLLAASDITKRFYNMACPTLTWSDNSDCIRSISSTLKKMAIDVAGKENIDNKEFNTVIETLTPLVDDYLYKIKNDDFESTIKEVFNLAQGGKGANCQELNSFYHIVNDVDTSTERGVFSEINRNKSDEIKNHLSSNIEELFTQFFTMSKYESAIKKNPQAPKISEIINNSILGLIEISPTCDYAQSQSRALRYVFSALIPHKYITDGIISSRGEHDGIHCFPEFIINDQLYSLRSNIRYVTSLPDPSPIFVKPLFRLREQVLNELIHKFSQHASRPGIIKFS